MLETNKITGNYSQQIKLSAAILLMFVPDPMLDQMNVPMRKLLFLVIIFSSAWTTVTSAHWLVTLNKFKPRTSGAAHTYGQRSPETNK